jgi:hypothetical protein
MEISIKAYIVSKEAELFYDCADRYALNTGLHKFAISDGVSKSFFPKVWSDILVKNWVSKEWVSNDKFIVQSQNDWLEQVNELVSKPHIKYYTKNAFNRKQPGLATFVGLKFYEKKKEWFWKAHSLGDSFLFFIPKNFKDFSKECIVLSSKQEPIIFDNFPDYLSSIGDKHKGVPGQNKESILQEGTFYLMTDALAEWFLNEKDNAISKIRVWRNQKDFEHFVDEERLTGKLGNDDSAILTIKLEEDNKDQLTYVLEDVSDINRLIKIQQEEIEVSEKAKEQELILQKENSNSAVATEQIEQEEPVENELSEEVETEIEKSKKSLIDMGFEKFKKGKEFFLGKIEKEQSHEQKEIDKKLELEHLKEKESSIQGEEKSDRFEETENSENIKDQESKQASKQDEFKTGEEALVKEENREEEPSLQDEENIGENEISKNSEINENKEEPESNTKTSHKPSQNITDKF